MKKQTAVEWLMNKSLKHTYILNTEYVKDKRIIIELDEFINLFEQAKQMEKEQMFSYTKEKQVIGENSMKFFKEDFEQYYNKTYKR